MTEPAASSGSTPDPDAADTDPFAVQDPHGIGLGAGWGGNWSAGSETTLRNEDVAASRFGGAHDRMPADSKTSSAHAPFAFPTSSVPGPRANTARLALMGVGAVVLLAAIGAAVWFMSRSSSTDADSTAQATADSPVTTSTTTEPMPTRDADAEARLLRVLPPGYPPNSCQPVDPEPGTVAKVNCTNNSDADGPTSASYVLIRDKAAPDAALTAAVIPDATVVCPGNIQSPGPWRRNAAPERVAGTLVCGMPAGVPTVAWTDVERMVVGVVRGGPTGPTLDQLYRWWSTHS
jgi:serine/threonine kinase PknH